MKKCIICNHIDSRVIFSEFEIDILQCQNCGHVYSSFNQDQNYDGYFGKISENCSEHYWWQKAHAKMYDNFCRKFIANKQGRLLDVGCGFGYFVNTVKKYHNWEVFGYEISAVATNFAINKLNLKNIFCGRVEESSFPRKHFDIITLWDVIEHIPDSNPLIKYLGTILKDDGFLFFHTPNAKIQLPKAKIKKLIRGVEPSGHYLEAKDHINIYSVDTISRLLYANGFKDIKFIHLSPIQKVAGSKSYILKIIKNLWFYFSILISFLTFNKINIDNLFVVAKK